MTISGIAIAMISIGQRLANRQAGISVIAKSNTRGNVIEAAMEASEIYRHSRTTTTHTKKAAAAQIV